MVIYDNFVPNFRFIDGFEIAQLFQLKIGHVGNSQHHSIAMKKICIYTSYLKFKMFYE